MDSDSMGRNLEKMSQWSDKERGGGLLVPLVDSVFVYEDRSKLNSSKKALIFG